MQHKTSDTVAMTREAPKWTLLSKSSLKLKQLSKFRSEGPRQPNIPKISRYNKTAIPCFKGSHPQTEFGPIKFVSFKVIHGHPIFLSLLLKGARKRRETR